MSNVISYRPNRRANAAAALVAAAALALSGCIVVGANLNPFPGGTVELEEYRVSHAPKAPRRRG